MASFMSEAVKEALDGMKKKGGGPFGCVIVKDGVIVGRGNNQVTSSNDPTCHAEVVAIRDTCMKLGMFNFRSNPSDMRHQYSILLVKTRTKHNFNSLTNKTVTN